MDTVEVLGTDKGDEISIENSTTVSVCFFNVNDYHQANLL